MDSYINKIRELEQQLETLKISSGMDKTKNVCNIVSSRYDSTYSVNNIYFTSPKTKVTFIQYCNQDTLVELDDPNHGFHSVSWKVLEYLYTLQSLGHINMMLADKVLEEVYNMNSWMAKVIIKLYMSHYYQLKSYVLGRIMYMEGQYPADIVNKIVSSMIPSSEVGDLILYV